jgi:L-alanine-DL-glutamate epimerase-like enolase superfamily enzyme
MGQKVRDRVSVAAWTRPAAPDEFAKEIRRAVDQGYRVFKMHSCDYHDVIEQTRAAEAVTPAGFQLHWDFNANRTLAAVLPLVAALERDHPIVGYIEDPIARTDIDGWRRLREQTRIPIVMHVPQLGGAQEMLHGLADIYMLDGSVGDTLERGWMYSRANVQTIIQQGAGTLGKAFALHMAAVLPSASGHSIHLDDQYEEDYTTTRIPVTEGFSAVPAAPGLGFDVDEDALARTAAREAPPIPRHVGVLTLPGGTKVYTPSIPSAQEITGREEGAIRGLSCEIWQDDGSHEFERAFAQAHG